MCAFVCMRMCVHMFAPACMCLCVCACLCMCFKGTTIFGMSTTFTHGRIIVSVIFEHHPLAPAGLVGNGGLWNSLSASVHHCHGL